MNLLKLAPIVQEQIHIQKLSAAHDTVLFKHLKGDEAAQLTFAGRAVAESLSVRELERYVLEQLRGEEDLEDPIERRLGFLAPTPTSELRFRPDAQPAEGDEIDASPQERELLIRLAATAALMAFNDQELRRELDVPLPMYPADVDAIYARVEGLEPARTVALLWRAVRRYFETGHRKSLIGRSIHERYMLEAPSSPPPGADKAGLG